MNVNAQYAEKKSKNSGYKFWLGINVFRDHSRFCDLIKTSGEKRNTRGRRTGGDSGLDRSVVVEGNLALLRPAAALVGIGATGVARAHAGRDLHDALAKSAVRGRRPAR
jgi:hypothetical protein